MKNTLRLLRALALIALATLVIAGTAHGATLYVATTGSNTTGTGSLNSPWATIQFAINNAAFTPGSEIVVQDGTYAPFYVDKSGSTAALRYTVRAAGTNARILDTVVYDDKPASIHVARSYVTIDGFIVDANKTVADTNGVRSRGIRVSGLPTAHVFDVRILNNKVSNAGWVGISTSYAENVLIEGNEIFNTLGQHGVYVANSADGPVIRRNVSHHNAWAGIQINSDPATTVNPGPPADGIIYNAVVEQNIVYNNGAGGGGSFDFASIRNSRIVNNLSYNNVGKGIVLWDDGFDPAYGSKDNLVANNTVVIPASSSQHALSMRNGSTGNTLRNNILLHLGNFDSVAIDSTSAAAGAGGTFSSNYNIVTKFEDTSGSLITLAQWRSQTGQDLNSFTATTSIFNNFAGNDFTLATGSAAINAGTTVALVTNDLLGTARPQGIAYDIGAYEKQSALAPPAAPTIGTASAGVGQASVSFTPPSNNGGSAILSYTATCGGQSATGPASPLTVMGLAPGVAVTCTVLATNAQGNSPPSAASNSITPPNVPGAPTLNSAVPGDTQITALFSPPASDGGSAITLYTVTCTAAMQPTRSNTGTASPIAVTGMTNEVAYACSVAATNAVGSGSASNTVMVTPSATAPLALIAVQSRKTHAAAGTFDLAVDTVPVITGAVTVESRAIGAGHSIVFLFNKTITATGTAAAVDTMAATIGSASATMAGNEVVVALTGVPDNRRATVSLDGVNGEVNNFPVSVGFLVGDVNNTRSVNASDISGVKARSGQTTSAANFKFDLNASGGINATDISAVKARSGLVLP